MIIKNKKSKIIFLCLVVLSLSIVTSLNSRSFLIFSHNAYERIMSIDPGFSSARNLTDQGEFLSQDMFSKTVSILKVIPKISSYQLTNNQKDIDQVEIVIKFKNYRKILKDRTDAINQGFLDQPTEVKGRVIYKGKAYKAKIRLKGDLADHWLSKHRMSLRVELKGDNVILGMNTFSVHKPRSRQHPYEQAFQNIIRKTGNLSANHQYIKVSVNGQNWGVMNIEEHLSKVFLEKQDRKDSLILRFSNDLKWRNYSKSTENPYPYYRLSDPKIIGSVYGQKKYFKEKIHRMRFTYIMEERLKNNHAFIYSEKEHMLAFYNALIWNNFHTLSVLNTKYYFNPYTLKLSPITSDQGRFYELGNNLEGTLEAIPMLINYQQLFKSFKDSPVMDNYFLDSLASFEGINDEINRYQNIFNLDQIKKADPIKKNMDYLKFNKEQLFNWIKDTSKSKPRHEKKALPTQEQALEFPEHIHVRHYDDGTLYIYNLLPDIVEITEILYEGKPLSFSKFQIPGYKEDEYNPIYIKTEYEGIQDGKISITSSYKAIKNNITALPTMLSKRAYNPLINQTKKMPSFFRQSENNSWAIIKGDWNIVNPIVIKGNLTIPKGTILNFNEDSYLIVKGGIIISGEDNDPVILQASENHWKGIYVLSNEEQSSNISNVIVKNTKALTDGILELTGGFNIYGGDIYIDNLNIQQSIAEDSLNIVNAKVSINNLFIQDSFSDGFDCDYCEGVINNSIFNTINGDALDFSGSYIEIHNADIDHVKDKGISVGEASNVSIYNSSIIDIGVGIASKDNSKATVKDTIINDYKLYAAMTYSKKKHFNIMSSLNLDNCDIEGDQPFLSQIGTAMIVDNSRIKEVNINVDKMYTEGPMRK